MAKNRAILNFRQLVASHKNLERNKVDKGQSEWPLNQFISFETKPFVTSTCFQSISEKIPVDPFSDISHQIFLCLQSWPFSNHANTLEVAETVAGSWFKYFCKAISQCVVRHLSSGFSRNTMWHELAYIWPYQCYHRRHKSNRAFNFPLPSANEQCYCHRQLCIIGIL